MITKLEKKEKFNINEIKEIIGKAIDLFLINDLKLLEIDSHERTISQNFTKYLNSKFPGWEIDCEYNRIRDEIKKLEINGKLVRIYPDIIIHHRMTKRNLLVIEIKKSPPYSLSDQDVKDDIERLKKMTIVEKYRYQYGLFILFFVKENSSRKPILKYYQNGEEV